ncbi:MAG: UDP-N-acetylmuramate dehydrogenase [Erysipelotrichaceae bacterium]|nr:UDP-N-acetylmuramate dehydrogenase [Erysipelotrichaceae bacterium]
MNGLNEHLRAIISRFGDVEENVPMKNLTSLRVGGMARYVVYPHDQFALVALLDICEDNGILHKTFGNGSNLLCSDDDYEGIIIKLNRGFNRFFIDEEEVINVQAGYSLVSLSYDCMRMSLSGLEFASGIPGTLGGCIYMNAGAYRSSMSDVVQSVQVVCGKQIITLSNEECEFGYRSSVFQKHPDWIIVSAVLKLKKGDKAAIKELMNERQQRRFATQPLNFPSAGSVFRNLEDHFAWQYIDMIGYRGKRYGDACVSEKHSNFIVNMGNATASDIGRLIDEICEKVRNEYNVEMITEVEKFNWKK